MPQSSLVVEVLHNAGTENRPDWSVGSGYVVAPDLVLTAAHVVGAGEILVRHLGRIEHHARIAVVSDRPDVDLALVEVIDRGLPDAEPVRFAQVDTTQAVRLRGTGVGFPWLKETPPPGGLAHARPLRDSVQLDGVIPTAEGLVSGRLALKVGTFPTVPPERQGPQSPWEGISGAVVFGNDDVLGSLAVGVVIEHHVAEGGNSLTVEPITALARLDAPLRLRFWRLLGIQDDSDLAVLPRRSAARTGRARLHGVPAPPRSFVEQADSVEAVVRHLADNSVVGIIGMGGAGKSVLAAAVARSCAPHYTDGVFWIRLGREPQVSSRQMQLAEMLGDVPSTFADPQHGTAHLMELFRDRVCLLILDDVWSLDHADPFLVVGDGSRVLMTSRNSDIVRMAGGTSYPIPAFTVQESLQLLATWTGREPADLPAQAVQLAGAVGGSPLALAVTGGTIAAGGSDAWRRVLRRVVAARLDTLAARPSGYEYSTVVAALEASVRDLPANAQRQFVQLAVFEGRGPIPVAPVQRLWRLPDRDDVLDLVDLLARRSLVQVSDDGQITVHDLLFAYARNELGTRDLQSLHNELAETYLRTWGGLPDVPALARGSGVDVDEWYGVCHVAAHLDEAGRQDDLHQLLAAESAAGNTWYRSRTQHLEAGGLIGYLDDVDRAWRAAEVALTSGGASEAIGTALALGVRYSLITSSLSSLAESVPSSLLPAAVRAGRMPWPEALALARYRADPVSRVRALADLARLVDDPEQSDLLAEAVERTRAVPDSYWQAGLLTSLAEQLPTGALQRARSVAESIPDELWRTAALRRLTVAGQSPLNDDGGVEEAVEPDVGVPATGRGFRDVDRGLAMFGQLEREAGWRLLSGAEDVRSTEALLGEAREIPRPVWRAHALAFVADQATDSELPSVVDEALRSARTVGDESAVDAVLGALAAAVVPESTDLAVWLVREMRDPLARATTCARLCAAAPGDAELIEAARTTARQTTGCTTDPDELAAVCVALARCGLDALALELLDGLAPHLRLGVLARAVYALDSAGGSAVRRAALAALDPQAGLEELVLLADSLSSGQVRAALATADEADDPDRLVAGLLPRLATTAGPHMLATYVTAIRDQFLRDCCLLEVCRRTADADTVRWGAAALSDPVWRVGAMAHLVRISASDEHVAEVLTLFADLDAVSQVLACSRALPILSRHVSPEWVDVLLSELTAILPSADLRISPVLTALVRAASAVAFDDVALRGVRLVPDEGWRATSIAELLALRPDAAARLADDVKALRSLEARQTGTTALARATADPGVFRDLLRLCAVGGRPAALGTLSRCADGIQHLGSAAGARQAAESILAVQRWWP